MLANIEKKRDWHCLGSEDKLKQMPPTWKIAISFFLPVFSPGEAVPKVQTVPLVKSKLTEIEWDQRKQWDTRKEEEIAKTRAKLVVVWAPTDDGNYDNDIETDIGEDGEATSGAPEVVEVEVET